MSLNALMQAQVARVFLSAGRHAQAITHWPAGDSGSAAGVDAIFDERPPDPELQGDRRGTLLVDDSVSTAETDAWVIDGETWYTIDQFTDDGGATHVQIRRFAYSVTRWACGVADDASTVEATFRPGDAVRETDEGVHVVATATLEVPLATAYDRGDVWVIGGVPWQVRASLKRPAWREIELTRKDPRHRRRLSNNVL